MTDVLNEKQVAEISQHIPAQRFGSPDDIAAAALYLASEEAGYMTGQTLHVKRWHGDGLRDGEDGSGMRGETKPLQRSGPPPPDPCTLKSPARAAKALAERAHTWKCPHESLGSDVG